MQKIKLFVSYKDKHKIIKSSIISPIQTGRAIADEVFDEMIGDDTGDNISVLNNRFCETTGIYWVWKNYEKIENPDYIGFMHYRRHFLFGDDNYVPNYCGLVKYSDLNEDYLKNNLDDEKIKKLVEQYDVIIPKRIENEIDNGVRNNYQQYKHFHNISDLDKALSLLVEKHPDYKEYVEEYKKSNYAYFLDMFIMKKNIFLEYCNWLFPLLFELRYIILPSSDSYQNRAIGFISERLTDIFFRKLYREKYKIKELTVSFIEDIQSETCNIRNRKKTIIPIVLGSSNIYIPYLSVCLQSIKDNITSDSVYEINILGRCISSPNKEIIKRQFNSENFIIKFHNADKLLEKFSNPKNLEHLSIDTYSRLFVQKILSEYDKCIYLDVDIIVKDDLAKLYNTSLDGKTIGASICAVMSGWVNLDKQMKNYIQKDIGISENCKYFQAGVLLFDLRKMRENNDQDKLIDIVNSKKWIFADQDVLNFYYKDDVKYIDMKWNYEYEHHDMLIAQYKEMMPLEILQKYIESKHNPSIIHYQGNIKPWNNPDEEHASIWWYYARKTPFYPCIIKNMIKNEINESIKKEKYIRNLIKKYPYICLRYWKYKILNLIVNKGKKYKYIQKKNILKDQIRYVKANIK